MIANVASDDALILPHDANPAGLNFRERQGYDGSSEITRNDGPLFWLTSASIANLSQVRAISMRMDCTLKFGSHSANRRHCAACCLHSTGVITHSPRNALPTASSYAAVGVSSDALMSTGAGKHTISGGASSRPHRAKLEGGGTSITPRPKEIRTSSQLPRSCRRLQALFQPNGPGLHNLGSSSSLRRFDRSRPTQ